MKSFILLSLLCLIYYNSVAQFNNYNTESKIWKKGIVYSQTGKQVQADLNYNFVTDRLDVRIGNTTKHFGANDIGAFLTEDSISTTYYFASDYEDHRLKQEGRFFFEIIHQKGDYMILRRHVIEYSSSGNHASLNGKPLGLKHSKETVFRTIYLSDKKKNILAVLVRKISNESTSSLDLLMNNQGMSESSANAKKHNENSYKKSVTELEKKKYRILEGRFEKFFGTKHYRFQKYVNENDLKLNTLTGLIQSLDFQAN